MSKQQPTPRSAWIALCLIILGVALAVDGIVLDGIVHLPALVTRTAGGIVILIGLIAEVWQAASTPLSKLIHQFNPGKLLGAVLVIPIAVAGITYLALRFLPTTTSSPTQSSPVPLLKQAAPNCNTSGEANWVSPNPSAVEYSCPGNGLLMWQISSTKYAEFDLTQVKGHSYSQTNFRTQVQATFQNTSDCSTWAAITFQTPPGSVGGYIFGVTACGDWRLQKVNSRTDIPIVQDGNIGASSSVTIKVEVQEGTLTSFLNGQPVISFPVGDPLGVAEVGLLVERDGAAPSSQVLFSDFELDT